AARRARGGEGGRHGNGEREPSGDVRRLERRLAEIVPLDHSGASGRRAAEAALARLGRRPRRGAGPARRGPGGGGGAVRGRTWVTRSGVHVDRIASAWLIRRFIDPKARVRFVAAEDHRPRAGELRFDTVAAGYHRE